MKKIWRALKRTACWTVKEARDLIKEMSGVEYQLPHVRSMLRDRGYTMKVSVGRHVQRASPQKIAGFRRRMKRLIPKKIDGYIRCVQDECIAVADACPRKRVYILKGKRAVYTYTGSHAKTVIFGLITCDGRSFFKQYDSRQCAMASPSGWPRRFPRRTLRDTSAVWSRAELLSARIQGMLRAFFQIS